MPNSRGTIRKPCIYNEMLIYKLFSKVVSTSGSQILLHLTQILPNAKLNSSKVMDLSLLRSTQLNRTLGSRLFPKLISVSPFEYQYNFQYFSVI